MLTYLLPPSISHFKAEVFHLFFHALAFLEFETKMIFLANSENFLEEEQMVILGIKVLIPKLTSSI